MPENQVTSPDTTRRKECIGASPQSSSQTEQDPNVGLSGGAPIRPKYDLLSIAPVKRLAQHRSFQFWFQFPNVLVYILVILTGLYGTQVSTSNFATVITWVIWWSAIVFTFVFVGRLWCFMCPFSAMAEWLQRFALWGVKRDWFSLNLKWPRRLRNLYLSIVFFLILTWVDHQFGLVSKPLYTAYFVLVILAAAIFVALLFERRTFCRYVCPIGGLIRTYSLFASAELRVADTEVCRQHKEKNCLIGNGAKGYGCPMWEYPGKMETNANCTLCTECIKTCPKNNITFRIRPFASDLLRLNDKNLGFDAALLAIVLLGLPTFQTIVMITPWEGWMKTVRGITGFSAELMFGITFLVATIIIPLGLFAATTAIAKRLAANGEVSHRQLLTRFAFAFVPIGLMMHLAHNVKHLFGEGQIIIPILSDPFGWGWNLFGTAGWQLASLFPKDMLTGLQLGLVTVGQGFAVYIAYEIAARSFGRRSSSLIAVVPFIALTLTWSIFNLWVLNAPLMERH